MAKQSVYETDEKVRSAVALVRQRLCEFQDKYSLNREQLAKKLAMSEGTLSHYTRPRNQSLPADATFKIMVNHGVFQSQDEIDEISRAISRMMSLSRRRGAHKRWGASNSMESTPTARPSTSVKESNGEVTDKVRQAFTLLAEALKVPATSDLLSLLLAQSHGRYEYQSVPAVLASENFQEINAADMPPEEVRRLADYAAFLLEEARRALLLVAQLAPEEVRNEVMGRLQRSLELFWPSYKVASSICPHKYVEAFRLETMFTDTSKHH